MRRRLEAAMELRPIRFVADVVGVYFGNHVSRSAAELAYFMVLTLFPIFICISAFVGQLHMDLAGLLAEAERFLPPGVAAILGDYLGYLQGNQSTAMFLVGVFMTVLFASAAVRGLMNIMREIYGRSTFRGLSQLVASVLFSLLLLFTIYLSLVVVVTGNWFFNLIEELFHLERVTERFGTWQWLAAAVLLTGADGLYAYWQDRVIFPRSIENYAAYQNQTPFLLPTRDSIRRCLGRK